MTKRKHDYYDLESDFESDLGSELDSDLDPGLESDLSSGLDSDLDSDPDSSTTSTDEEWENFFLEGGSPSIIATDFGEFDNNLWGSLDRHINMAENVYSRLPFEDFFNLRTVCKDWYRIACKRLALKERLWKPFFTLYTKAANGRLDGMLAYNASSKSWDWRRSGTYHDPDFQLVANESLVFSYSNMKPPWSVFHWEDQRTGTCYLVPPPPVWVNEKTIIGMSRVHNDGGEVGFRVLLGSEHSNTLVYDSKTNQWEIKPCRPKPKTPGDMQAGTGCVECNGRMYITTEHRRGIFVYDFEKVTWCSIKSPLKWVTERDLKKRRHACLDTLGAWNGRVFDVTVSCPAYEYYDYASRPTGRLSVWELVDESSEHEWTLYDCMPQDLYAWLRSTEGFRRSFNWKTRVGHVTVHASFCGDYMLVYSWNYVMGDAGRFCLYDMAFKNWQKLQIPMGKVGFAEESESEFIPSSFFGLESFTSELIDPENEPYFLGSDMSDAELDLFLEENCYECDPGSDGAF